MSKQLSIHQMVDYHVPIFNPELITNLSSQGFDFKKSRFQIIDERNYVLRELGRNKLFVH